MRLYLLWTISVLILTITPPSFAISCGSTIKGSTTVLTFNILCPQNGFLLEGAATLDCQGHSITGSGTGIGIQLTSSYNHLSNCRISGFDTGILVNNTYKAALESVTLSQNTIGLYAIEDSQTSVNKVLISSHAIGSYLQGSSIQPLTLTFEHNNQNSVVTTPYYHTMNQLQTEYAIPPPKPTLRLPSQQEFISSLDTINIPLTEPSAELLNQAGVSGWMSSASQQSVAASKHAILLPDSTIITISVQALHDIFDLSIVEYIPKEIALDSSTIIQSDPPFTVRHEDLVIEFQLGSLTTGEQRNITYTIDHRLAPQLIYSPFTILSVVERITPKLFNLASMLSIIFASLLAVYQYLRYKTQQPPLIGLYTAGYILSLTIITALGWIQTRLILSPAPTAYTIIGLLLFGMAILTIQCHSLFQSVHQLKKEEV